MPTAVHTTELELATLRRQGMAKAALLRASTPRSLADMAVILASGRDWQWLRGTFLDWMRQPTLVTDAKRQAALDTEPPLTGDPVKDAELAGMAEQLAADYGLAVPAWVEAPVRFLPECSGYWMYDTPEGRAILREKGLAAFARHGIHVMPNHLTRG